MTFLLTSWVPWGSSLHLRRLVARQHKGGAGLTRAGSRPKPSGLTLWSSTPASLKAREIILSEILKRGKWQWWPTTVESFVAKRSSSLDSSPGHKKRPPSWATFQKELFTTRTKRVQIVSVFFEKTSLISTTFCLYNLYQFVPIYIGYQSTSIPWFDFLTCEWSTDLDIDISFQNDYRSEKNWFNDVSRGIFLPNQLIERGSEHASDHNDWKTRRRLRLRLETSKVCRDFGKVAEGPGEASTVSEQLFIFALSGATRLPLDYGAIHWYCRTPSNQPYDPHPLDMPSEQRPTPDSLGCHTIIK